MSRWSSSRSTRGTRGTRGTRARNTQPHSRNAGCTALSAWARTMYTVRSLTGCVRGQSRRETRGSTGGTDCRVSPRAYHPRPVVSPRG